MASAWIKSLQHYKALGSVIACVVLLTLVGCNSNRRNPIPDFPVALDINIMADAPELVPILGYKEYVTPIKITDYLGYGGILIYHTANVEGNAYCAFDMSCPHECQAHIRVHCTQEGTAVCDSCGSVYMLLDGTGFANSGPTKYQLKKYSVTQSGYNLYIRR